jgi:hypothetical protein
MATLAPGMDAWRLNQRSIQKWNLDLRTIRHSGSKWLSNSEVPAAQLNANGKASFG